MSYSIKKAIYQNFTDEELCEIFEFARVAMQRDFVVDAVLEKMDLADEAFWNLRDKLEAFMEKGAA